MRRSRTCGSSTAPVGRATSSSPASRWRSRWRCAAPAQLPAPRLHVALRDDAGLLVAEEDVDTAPLGWRPGNGGLRLRLDVPSPPLQFGRFHVELELLSADGGRLLHGLTDALSFVVYPDDDGRGLVRLGGTWSAGANEEPR